MATSKSRTLGREPITGVCVQSDRKSTRLNSSHGYISYAVFCLKKKKKLHRRLPAPLDNARHPLDFIDQQARAILDVRDEQQHTDLDVHRRPTAQLESDAVNQLH